MIWETFWRHKRSDKHFRKLVLFTKSVIFGRTELKLRRPKALGEIKRFRMVSGPGFEEIRGNVRFFILVGGETKTKS